MARKPSERTHSTEDVHDVNIMPIMNIICILIPLLLLTASFFQITVTEVHAPKYKSLGAESEEQEPDKKPLSLTVVVSHKEGYMVTTAQQSEVGGDATPGEKIEKVPCPQPPKGAKRHPMADEQDLCFQDHKLYNYLYSMHKEYPDEKVIHITAEPNTEWKYVAQAMDAARYALPEEEYTDWAAYEVAGPAMEQKSETDKKTGKQVKKKVAKKLFPHVVFTIVR